MLIEVMEYNSDFPEGFTRQIKSSLIEKFYTTPEDYKYTVRETYGVDSWSKKYKDLINSGKLFTLWNTTTKRTSAYVKVDCHPIMIEVRYASDTHIYDDSTYIQHYWCNMTLEEFTKLYGSEKYVVEDKPIENRWEILDIRRD